MCLHVTKLTHKQVAEKDILVFKFLYESKGKYLSYFRDNNYQIGIYKSNIVKKEIKLCDNPYCFHISKALYSYEIDTRIIKHKTFYEVGYGINNNYYHDKIKPDDLRVGLFVIPKGSTYYYRESNYASNQLICTGKFYTIKKFLSKQEYLRTLFYIHDPQEYINKLLNKIGKHVLIFNEQNS